MGDSIRIRIKKKKGLTTVQAIIKHPMETGFRIDEKGNKIIPPHFIKWVKVYQNEALILSCDWSRAVSKNPYLSFSFEPAHTGDVIRLAWIDNLGETDAVEQTIV